MTEIEKKALALVNEVRSERGDRPVATLIGFDDSDWDKAFYRALEELEAEKAARAAEREQHEAFRQEVSEIVEQYVTGSTKNGAREWERLKGLIIAKPDPLVEAWVDMLRDSKPGEDRLEVFRAALAARGLKIVEDK